MKSEKTYLYFSIYLTALKYCLYINRRKKWKITDFCEMFFSKMGTSPKSSFFQRLARGLRSNDGVVQRVIQQGSTTGKQNGKQQRKMKSGKKNLDCAPRCFTKHFIEMTERSFHRGFPLPVVFPYCGPRCTTSVMT